MRCELLVADLTQLDADPALYSHVGRAIICGRIRCNQGCLMSGRRSQGQRNVPIVVVIGGHHREDALFDEESGLAVRQLFERARKGEADAAYTRQVIFRHPDLLSHADPPVSITVSNPPDCRSTISRDP